MKKSIFIYLLFCTAWLVEAKELDYKNVYMSGTGGSNLIIRYLLFLDDPCLVVQTLVPGGKGKVSTENRICSLDGKGFSDGYADVDFKKGIFESDRLFFEIGITPLRPVGETVKYCEVIFRNGLADHLLCDFSEPKEEVGVG